MEESTTSGSTPNKNYLYIIGAMGALAVLVGVYAFKNQAKTETTVSTVEQTIVKYTSAGFSPASLTIKKGTTVKFVNTSGQKVSVTSNPHPAHTDYPEFDQWKSDAKGKDEYSFTFEKVGSWGYHDHLKASNRGTIVVTEGND